MTKLAFGSCSKIQNQSVQPAWKSIHDERPDRLLILGDFVYSPALRWSHRKLEKRFIQQLAEPNFKALIADVPYNAVWDDHDFGPNNSKGGHVSDTKRRRSRDIFHQYMRCSTNMPHIYHSFELGDVKVIMLDVRYYRRKWHKREPTILGAEQEAWLESELRHDKKFTVVCSASCLTEGGSRLAKYIDHYAKLTAQLKAKPRTLFLSGDIHENNFIAHDGFFEATSSGIGRNGLNNYGIVEFMDDAVTVRLRGAHKSDNRTEVINVESWTLQTT